MGREPLLGASGMCPAPPRSYVMATRAPGGQARTVHAEGRELVTPAWNIPLSLVFMVHAPRPFTESGKQPGPPRQGQGRAQTPGSPAPSLINPEEGDSLPWATRGGCRGYVSQPPQALQTCPLDHQARACLWASSILEVAWVILTHGHGCLPGPQCCPKCGRTQPLPPSIHLSTWGAPGGGHWSTSPRAVASAWASDPQIPFSRPREPTAGSLL